MMARRGVLGGLIGGAALILMMAGRGLGSKSSYRFKLTVEVDTPEGLRSGSSVYEVTAWNQFGLDPSGQVRRWEVKGEAVAVELPNGKMLFSLLKTGAIHNDLAGMSMTALDPAFKNDIVESARRIARRNGIRSPAAVAPSDYPLLVTFRDLSDPASIEKVAPDDLSMSFGSGFALKAIAVEVTDDAVTTGIEKRLVWLPDVHQILRGREFKPAGIPVGNFKGLFETESRQ